MGLTKNIECISLPLNQQGGLNFFAPQQSDWTSFVEIPPNTQDNLFCHRFQTDQLFVVRGKLVLVILQNKKYRYIPLTQDDSTLIKIPPGIPHAAINLNSEPCWVVNAIIYHDGSPNPKDYNPIKKPFPFDMDFAVSLFEECDEVNNNNYLASSVS